MPASSRPHASCPHLAEMRHGSQSGEPGEATEALDGGLKADVKGCGPQGEKKEGAARIAELTGDRPGRDVLNQAALAVLADFPGKALRFVLQVRPCAGGVLVARGTLTLRHHVAGSALQLVRSVEPA